MKKLYFLLILLIASNMSFGQNILTNGGFETWSIATEPDSWTLIDSGITLSEETTIVDEGSSAMRVDVTTGTQGSTDFRQSVTVISGTVYDVSVRVYHLDAFSKARLYEGGYGDYSDSGTVGSWQTLSGTFTATADESIEFGVRFYDQTGFSGSSLVILDDFIVAPQVTPSLTITSPSNNAIVFSTDVDVEVGVQNFNVANGTGDGHIVYSLDGGSDIDKFDTTAINLTGLSYGSHTVDMELVDNGGASLGTPVTSSVTFGVSQTQTLPYKDSFSYTAAENLSDQAPWTNYFSGDEVLVNSGSLTYSTEVGTGNSISLDGSGADPVIDYTASSSGKVYASFMLDVTDLSSMTESGYFAVLRSDSGSYVARVWIDYIDVDTYNIGLTGDGTPLTQITGPYDDDTTIFIVFSYDLDNDIVSAWINPTLGTTTEPTADLTEGSGTSGVTLSQFFIRQDSSSETPFMVMDELTITTTWVDAVLDVTQNEIEGFSIYPNPVSNGEFSINSLSNSDRNVQIYDMLGKQVYAKNVLASERVNVANLNTGIYILKVLEEGKTATRKLVIR